MVHGLRPHLLVQGAPSPGRAPRAFTTRRSSWAELLKRVFVIDALVRPHCGGGERKLISIVGFWGATSTTRTEPGSTKASDRTRPMAGRSRE